MQPLTDLPSYLRACALPGTAVFEATAPWCEKCRAIGPFVDLLEKKYPDARFYSYDTDSISAGAIAQELGANLLPSFHVFKDGDLVDAVTGARPKELENAVKEAYGDGKVVEAEQQGRGA
jgi:thioredoxin 1